MIPRIAYSIAIICNFAISFEINHEARFKRVTVIKIFMQYKGSTGKTNTQCFLFSFDYKIKFYMELEFLWRFMLPGTSISIAIIHQAATVLGITCNIPLPIEIFSSFGNSAQFFNLFLHYSLTALRRPTFRRMCITNAFSHIFAFYTFAKHSYKMKWIQCWRVHSNLVNQCYCNNSWNCNNYAKNLQK